MPRGGHSESSPIHDGRRPSSPHRELHSRGSARQPLARHPRGPFEVRRRDPPAPAPPLRQLRHRGRSPGPGVLQALRVPLAGGRAVLRRAAWVERVLPWHASTQPLRPARRSDRVEALQPPRGARSAGLTPRPGHGGDPRADLVLPPVHGQLRLRGPQLRRSFEEPIRLQARRVRPRLDGRGVTPRHLHEPAGGTIRAARPWLEQRRRMEQGGRQADRAGDAAFLEGALVSASPAPASSPSSSWPCIGFGCGSSRSTRERWRSASRRALPRTSECCAGSCRCAPGARRSATTRATGARWRSTSASTRWLTSAMASAPTVPPGSRRSPRRARARSGLP